MYNHNNIEFKMVQVKVASYFITFVVFTYNRKEEIERLINSSKEYIRTSKIKIVIFDYGNNDLSFSNTKNIDFEIIKKNINNGKTSNFIDFVKQNKHSSKYFCILDDKDFFIKKLDDFINYMINTKKDLYSIKLKYINHPKNLLEPKKILNGISMYDYYIKRRSKYNGDRIWIFASKLYDNATYPNFVKSEISIQGMLINYFYYKIKSFSNIDESLICRCYSKDGYSNKRDDIWIKNSPNSELYEIYLFYKITNNFLYKIYFAILFEKKYNILMHNKENVSIEIQKIHNTFRKKYKWLLLFKQFI